MRSSLRLAAAAALCVCVVPALPTAVMAKSDTRTIVQIATIVASNSSRFFDVRLTGMRTELKQLRFRSYKLVSSENRTLQGAGGQCGVELPGGRYLNITTREHASDHLRLHILLNEDNRPVINTYVKLELGSVVLLGGPRDENGTLVIAIASRPAREDEKETGKARRPVPRKSAETPAPRTGPMSLPMTPSHPSVTLRAPVPSLVPKPPTGQDR